MTCKLMTASVSVLSIGLYSAATAQEVKSEVENWTSISGTVTEVGPESLVLDHKDGLVTVELDDFDWSSETMPLSRDPIAPGAKVTVTGRWDEDMFETRALEASSVFVEGRDTYYLASADDEEDAYLARPLLIGEIAPVSDGASISVTGEVSKVDGRMLTLDLGANDLAVSTAEMVYNPVDDTGVQEVEVGDVVQVSGRLDEDFFTNRELVAQRVTTLFEEERTGA